MSKTYLRWAAVVAYCGLIFYLSSLSPDDVPLAPDFWNLDKFLHALEYGLLSFLLAWAFYPEEKRKGALLAIVVASLYAISDEFHQSFVPGREASVGDWLADTSGAALAQIGLMVRVRLYPGKEDSANR